MGAIEPGKAVSKGRSGGLVITRGRLEIPQGEPLAVKLCVVGAWLLRPLVVAGAVALLAGC